MRSSPAPRQQEVLFLDRLPPQDLEAEEMVLGSMMISRTAAETAIDVLRPSDFYRDSHRIIFESIGALLAAGEPPDLGTVTGELRKRSRFDQIGGHDYLSRLVESVPTAAHCEHYAKIVSRMAMRREFIAFGGQLTQWAFEDDAVPEELVDRAEKRLFDLARKTRAADPVRIGDAAVTEFARIEEASVGGWMTGTTTGFDNLDWMTGGLQRATLTLLAARPSVGKTALALTAACFAAKKHGPVLVFSLEMSWREIVGRLIASETRIDSSRLRAGDINSDGDENSRLVRVVGQLGDLPLWIDDTTNLTPRELRSRVRRFTAKNGQPALVMVDYVQLVVGEGNPQNKHHELTDISRALKGVAREADCPLLVLSQLSRAVEGRKDRRPQMSDLRESGALEADADLILLLYRDDYYLRPEERSSSDLQLAELNVAKHRNGPTGLVKLGFVARYARFENLMEDR